MEALALVLNSFIIVILVYQGLRDDARAPGIPATGLFRPRDVADAGGEQK